MIKSDKKFKYTMVVYYVDGSTKKIERSANADDYTSRSDFDEKVMGWNRQGEMMKGRKSITSVKGYEYFTTPEQHQHNVGSRTIVTLKEQQSKKITCPKCKYQF